MNIQVPKDRINWLNGLVESGRFDSIEQAMEAAVAALQAEIEFDDVWAKPYIEEALRSLERGEGKPWTKGDALKEFHARHPELVNEKSR